MENRFESASVREVKERIESLGAESAAEWGSMSAAQALAHCTCGLEMALGDSTPPRVLIGRLIGGVIKPMVLKDEVPMRRNSPTVKGLVIEDDCDLAKEKERLTGMIDRFVAGGPAVCSAHPHAFFGEAHAAGVGHPYVQAPGPPFAAVWGVIGQWTVNSEQRSATRGPPLALVEGLKPPPPSVTAKARKACLRG